MHRIRKQFTFEAAHQLEPGCFTEKCSDCIHGHSYTVELVLERLETNTFEMVIDFGELKEFTERVMRDFDHGLILHSNKRPIYQPLIDAGHLKKSKVFFSHLNPTAEVIAKTLAFDLEGFLREKGYSSTLTVKLVRVHETGTGWAEFEMEHA